MCGCCNPVAGAGLGRLKQDAWCAGVCTVLPCLHTTLAGYPVTGGLQKQPPWAGAASRGACMAGGRYRDAGVGGVACRHGCRHQPQGHVPRHKWLHWQQLASSLLVDNSSRSCKADLEAPGRCSWQQGWAMARGQGLWQMCLAVLVAAPAGQDPCSPVLVGPAPFLAGCCCQHSSAAGLLYMKMHLWDLGEQLCCWFGVDSATAWVPPIHACHALMVHGRGWCGPFWVGWQTACWGACELFGRVVGVYTLQGGLVYAETSGPHSAIYLVSCLWG